MNGNQDDIDNDGKGDICDEDMDDDGMTSYFDAFGKNIISFLLHNYEMSVWFMFHAVIVKNICVIVTSQ